MDERAFRILVIDGSAESREELRVTLRGAGYDCVAAVSGHVGLGLAREIEPDFILIDLALLDFDGYALAEQLKSEPATRRTPIIS